MIESVLVIIVAIVCASFGFGAGFGCHAWRQSKRSPTANSLMTPSKTGAKAEHTCLEEVKIESCCAAAPNVVAADCKPSSPTDDQQQTPESFDVGLPPPGLPSLRTPLRHQRSQDMSQIDQTPRTAVFSQQDQGPQLPRPRSPTAHLMGHLVRCASQAMEQFESRSVLHRLTSADASTPFFSSSPTAAFGLFTPAPSGLLSSEDSAAFQWGSADEIHMDEVDLISKLGGGAFGSVYKGMWRGAPVAIKYIRTRTDKADSLGAAIREVMLSKKMTHPNVVQTFSWTVLSQPLPEVDAPNSGKSDASIPLESFSKRLERSETLESANDSIPAVWNRTESSVSIRILSQKQELSTPVVAPAVSSSTTTKESSGSRGVKRRRTGDQNTPPSVGLDPRMDSFNSEEGFGSPVKKNKGGVQSIFSLEGLQLSETEALLVVVMEHCDLGTLQRALQRRAFLPSAKWPHHATFRALLRTAAEIAKGMEYIHSQHGVVHGDLKPANVLLKTHRADRRGYIAKIADFGLSGHASDGSDTPRSALETASSLKSARVSGLGDGGTVAYLAPEAFESLGLRGCPADVYSFGIILWEMLYCKAPYEGLLEAQVCAGVIEGWLRPEFEDDCPVQYKILAEQCWAQDPISRPTFAEVWRELVKIELEFRSQRHRNRSGSFQKSESGVFSAQEAQHAA